MLKKAEVQSNTNRYFDSIRCPNAAFSGVIDELSLSVAALISLASSSRRKVGRWPLVSFG